MEMESNTMSSNRHVAVWIDHQEARIFHVDDATIDETTVRAPAHHVHRHPKPTAEHNHPDDAHHFFQAVARALEGAERVLVVGPSTAKLQFIRYAHKHDPKLEPRIVGVETVDHPTDGQLVAYAKRYFVADDRMQGLPGELRH
jgi:stalled ribosome rescue protein Dom34